MNIQFCDLCNESVAAKELKAGSAYLRGDRLICAACDKAMGGGGFSDGAQAASGSAPRPGGSWALTGVTGICVVLAGWALYHARAMDAEVEVLSQRMDVVDTQVAERWGRMETERTERWSNWSQGATGDLEARGEAWAERLSTLQSDVESAGRKTKTAQEKLRADWLAWKQAEETAPAADEPWLEAIDTLRKRIEEQRLANEEVWVVLADRLQSMEEAVRAPVTEAGADESAPWFALTKNLTNSNPGLRLEALFSLEQTRDRRVCSYLVPLLTDPDPLVRVACARVLKDHRYRGAVPFLIGGLEDPVLTVRIGFLDALHVITKRQFGYRPDGRESERRRPLKDWQDWWKKMGDGFLSGDSG